ncbi:STAS domain-containing protein [Actinomadura rudentiformis]|uniref:STAS domain-containing protein n=1 Tax=Actinomadura rudentiformis TaxID=359158 RepID=UPI00178C4385|nr:STAS domain-containing protein [Actinomadura rudentiformis]
MLETLGAKVDRIGLWTVIHLTGELDLCGRPVLTNAIDQAGLAPQPRVIVDMTDVWFMDSSGLESLLRSSRWIHARGGRLVLLGLHHRVRKILDITGTHRAFETVESLNDLPG